MSLTLGLGMGLIKSVSVGGSQEITITDTLDDGYSFGGNLWVTDASTFNGNVIGFAGVTLNIGSRFPGLLVPQGATITSAIITLNQATLTGTPTGTWYGWDVDDGIQFDPVTNYPTNAAQTTATTAFVMSGSGSKILVEHNVTAIAQELVDRPGYVVGAMNFFAIGSAVSGIELSDDVETSGSPIPAKLTISWGAAPREFSFEFSSEFS